MIKVILKDDNSFLNGYSVVEKNGDYTLVSADGNKITTRNSLNELVNAAEAISDYLVVENKNIEKALPNNSVNLKEQCRLFIEHKIGGFDEEMFDQLYEVATRNTKLHAQNTIQENIEDAWQQISHSEHAVSGDSEESEDLDDLEELTELS